MFLKAAHNEVCAIEDKGEKSLVWLTERQR
jgi:hypothetical protein